MEILWKYVWGIDNNQLNLKEIIPETETNKDSLSCSKCAFYQWWRFSTFLVTFLRTYKSNAAVFFKTAVCSSVAILRDLSPIPRFWGVSWRQDFCKNRTRFLREIPRFWRISYFWRIFRDFCAKCGQFQRFWDIFWH